MRSSALLLIGVINPAYMLIGTWSHGHDDLFEDRDPNGPVQDGPAIKLDLKPPPL